MRAKHARAIRAGIHRGRELAAVAELITKGHIRVNPAADKLEWRATKRTLNGAFRPSMFCGVSVEIATKGAIDLRRVNAATRVVIKPGTIPAPPRTR